MAGDDADMELPVEHPALDTVEGGHMQVQAHTRCSVGEQGDGRRNMGLRIAGCFVKHRDLQLPAHALVDFIHAAAKSVGRREQLGGLGINLLPFRGERKTGAPPAAQHQAQPGFQVFDVAAHGGGADIELQLGCRHAAAIGHRAEHAQQAQVHVADLAQGGPASYGDSV